MGIMSGMADEMSRRIADDEGQGLVGDGAGVVPGSEAAPPTPEVPSAETLNTDTSSGEGPPDAIPYARFKEVNDRYNELRGFETLTSFGYDPDSLGRLAAFEAQYLHDPIGTWANMADNLDLPQGVKDAIEAHLTSGSAGAQPSDTGTPTPELPEEVRQQLAYVDQLRAREAEDARTQQLQRLVGHWDTLDEKDGIKTPEFVKLSAISALAGSGQQFRTVEELAEAARKPIVDYRSELLGDAIQRTGRQESPASPSGSTPVPAGRVKFTSIRDASRAAEEAIKRGDKLELDV